jgi:lysophospholipase L1-like esterase
MLKGYPHRQEDSFFQLALGQVASTVATPVVSSLYTLGGFPITHVPKHLARHCLDAKPDVVVIQFASSDLVVPLGLRRKLRGRKRKATVDPVVVESPTLRNQLIWYLQGLVGDKLQLKSVTAPEVYITTMLQIIQTFLDHHIIPVVMSPFVFGSRRSDRFAQECSVVLHQAMTTLPQAAFVDAYSVLNRHPRHKTLLADGTHLSLFGHQVVADALLPSLKSTLQKWA